MRKIFKKAGAIVLSLAMVGTMIPSITSFAEDDYDVIFDFETDGEDFDATAAMKKVRDKALASEFGTGSSTVGVNYDYSQSIISDYYYIQNQKGYGYIADGVEQDTEGLFPTINIVKPDDFTLSSIGDDDRVAVPTAPQIIYEPSVISRQMAYGSDTWSVSFQYANGYYGVAFGSQKEYAYDGDVEELDYIADNVSYEEVGFADNKDTLVPYGYNTIDKRMFASSESAGQYVDVDVAATQLSYTAKLPQVQVIDRNSLIFTEGVAKTLTGHFEPVYYDENAAVSNFKLVWVKYDLNTGMYTKSDMPSYMTSATLDQTEKTVTLAYNGGAVPTDAIYYFFITGDGKFYGYDYTNQVVPYNDYEEMFVPLEKEYVYFYTNGGTEIDPVQVVKGETLTLPADPVKDGFDFGGWYYDDETFESPFDANEPITSSTYLYAKWIGKVSDVTDPEENDFSGKIDSDKADLKEAVLTDDEIAAVESGKNVKIWLETEDITASVAKADKDAALAKAGNEYKDAIFVDINLFKQIDDDDPIKVSETNKPITFEIALPDELINKDEKITRKFTVIRVHNGVATELPCEFADGKLLVSSDMYSTYMVAYKDTVKSDEGGEAEPENKGTDATAPKTGDTSSMGLVVMMMAMAAAAGVVVYRKREF